MTGIEPALSAWEADVLPLNYIRLTMHFVRLRLLSHLRHASNVPQALERRNFRLAHVGRTELALIAPWLAATRGISQRAGALDIANTNTPLGLESIEPVLVDVPSPLGCHRISGVVHRMLLARASGPSELARTIALLRTIRQLRMCPS
jgi:hypothetical protein